MENNIILEEEAPQFSEKFKNFAKTALFVLDSVSIFVCLAIAFNFAFKKQYYDESLLPHFYQTLFYYLLIKTIIFSRMGLYKAILRYASFLFAVTIVKAVTISSVLAFLVYSLVNQTTTTELLIVDWGLSLVTIGFIRFFPRYYLERKLQFTDAQKNVLIYGAGDVGDAVARIILKDQERLYKIVGFLDDNPNKQGRKVHNIPVFGDLTLLENVTKKRKIDELIVAISNYPADSLRDLVTRCRSLRIFCRLAPTIPNMINEDLHLKNIDVADLLKRNPEDLDELQIKNFIENKKILVTGAAGSIGSELVRQCLKFKAAKILLLDNSEYGLYRMEEEIRETSPNILHQCEFILLSLTHKEPLNDLIAKEKPDLIVHAAAYKHVPLVEANPFEAVHNNVIGTLNLADCAHNHNIEKFVLISTDKAVRPTNIMGATKRICELYIQNLNFRSQTEFVAVRFGNVLGSSGSVIPKFLQQLKMGGPITVTHPDVVRYFMLIEEAVELTLQAASIGHGSEIFILDMGKPVRIKEVAEDLIFLAGKEPYRDIDIVFTGLRPGEKLYEELLLDQTEKKTQYANITIAKNSVIDWNNLVKDIEHLINVSKSRDRAALLLAIKTLVGEFMHAELKHLESSNGDGANIIPMIQRA